jgi:tRNA(Arg) A34 adenosine deaminase TadA
LIIIVGQCIKEMTRQDLDFMRRAINLAKGSMETNSGGPFGVVIVKNGEIIAEGYNQVTARNDPTAHAEIVAIRKACKVLNSFQLNECVIYTSCEPCPMCLGAIYWARPSKVYYASSREDASIGGFDDQLIYDEIEKDGPVRIIPFHQILRDEAKQIFNLWLEKDDKILY